MEEGCNKGVRGNRICSEHKKEKMASVLTDLSLKVSIIAGLDKENLNSLANTLIQNFEIKFPEFIKGMITFYSSLQFIKDTYIKIDRRFSRTIYLRELDRLKEVNIGYICMYSCICTYINFYLYINK
jgi:hypothetical protein